MKPIEVTTEIEASPQRVFEACTDFASAADRVTGIESIEMLTDGPVGVGTRFRETRRFKGHTATEEMEVAEFDRPGLVVLTARSHGMSYRTSFTFAGRKGDSRTDVTFRMHAKPVSMAGWLMSPLGFLMAGWARKCVEQDLADIKSAVESGARS